MAAIVPAMLLSSRPIATRTASPTLITRDVITQILGIFRTNHFISFLSFHTPSKDGLDQSHRARVKEHRLAENPIGLVCRLPRAQGLPSPSVPPSKLARPLPLPNRDLSPKSTFLIKRVASIQGLFSPAHPAAPRRGLLQAPAALPLVLVSLRPKYLRVVLIGRSPATGSPHRAGCEDERAIGDRTRNLSFRLHRAGCEDEQSSRTGPANLLSRTNSPPTPNAPHGPESWSPLWARD